MGETITLKSPFDGFALSAYRAPAAVARRGGVVLFQEIFGVNAHIRELADSFAEEGFETIAPSYYDRLRPGFETGYEGQGRADGVAFSQATPWDQVAADTQAAIDALKGPVFAVGYCWGGAAAWLAGARCKGLSAVSCYYGRRISDLLDEPPKVPAILHFGRTDASIPMERVDEIAERYPDIPIHLYDAGHGFSCDQRADYAPDPARLARLRTLQLFARNTGVRAEM
jgi:carboxymethylenebutenolidase